MDQIIDKALIIVQQTGLYKLAIIKWNAFNAANHTWPDFRMHFGKAYDTHLRSGAGTANANVYHNTANAINATDFWHHPICQQCQLPSHQRQHGICHDPRPTDCLSSTISHPSTGGLVLLSCVR